MFLVGFVVGVVVTIVVGVCLILALGHEVNREW